MLSFPCNQFLNQMPYGDGDEMLCHLKSRNAAPGAIMAKVNITHKRSDYYRDLYLKITLSCNIFQSVLLKLGECEWR